MDRLGLISKKIFISLLMLCAISLTVVRLMLIGVNSYKTELENKLFEATNMPITIGLLKGSMRGINPEITLKDIRVFTNNKQGNPVIRLKSLQVGVDLTTLLFSGQLLSSSWVTLVGTELSIVRNEEGRLSIVGIKKTDSESPLWLAELRQYKVLNSKIIWIDKKRNVAAVTFNNIEVIIKNDKAKLNYPSNTVKN